MTGKILALDLGDQWVGTALSDITYTVAKPYKTVTVSELENFLHDLFHAQSIGAIIIGYPKTMKGTISAQTQKVIDMHQKLESLFPGKTFILWDERLSSKRAAADRTFKTKEEKIHSHSIAAAYILDSYLSYLAHQRSAFDD